MKFMRLPPVQFVLYLLLRAVVMVVHMFPVESAPRIAKVLGILIRWIDVKHRPIALKNVTKTEGLVAPSRIPRFIRKVYEHLGLCLVEMLMMPRYLRKGPLTRIVRLEGWEQLAELQKEGKGVILAIGHQGNWELCGLAANQAGYRLNSLARPIDNPWVNRYLHRFRTWTGQEIITKHGALGSMIKVLRENKLLVVQIDQDSRRTGVYVRFFGRPASTQRSPALLSLKYGSPIVVADIHRTADGHRVVLAPPIRPDGFRSARDPIQALTQAVTAVFERAVRAHPEQWFWIHDRWKTAERVAAEDPSAVAC
jgi:KDO2-lipid IV(A) lauroyltransferase